MKDRWLKASIQKDLEKPFFHILFGARQTGKTTLIQTVVPEPSLQYNLA